MNDKALKLAYGANILAAVIGKMGCDDIDSCVDKTIEFLNSIATRKTLLNNI